jgi:phage shock protein C
MSYGFWGNRFWRPAGPQVNPHRLYRDRDNSILSGVCAGIADYFGVAPILVRLAVIAGLFMFPPVVFATYVVMTLAVPARPPKLYGSPADEAFWRSVSTAPDRTLATVGDRFRDLEQRLRRIETTVTSGDADLRRRFRDLGM